MFYEMDPRLLPGFERQTASDSYNAILFLSDCTAPFAIDIFTDKLDDLGATGGTNVEQSRGK